MKNVTQFLLNTFKNRSEISSSAISLTPPWYHALNAQKSADAARRHQLPFVRTAANHQLTVTTTASSGVLPARFFQTPFFSLFNAEEKCKGRKAVTPRTDFYFTFSPEN